jgi:hypothetical protein
MKFPPASPSAVRQPGGYMDETKKPEETVKPVESSVELNADELKQVVGGTDAASPNLLSAASGKHISKAVLYVR